MPNFLRNRPNDTNTKPYDEMKHTYESKHLSLLNEDDEHNV